MDNTEIYKLTLNPVGFTIGLEFHTGGKDLRILSKEQPRQGLYVACARVVAIGIDFYELPDSLQVGLKSIAFSNSDDPGSVVQAEGFIKKIRLQLPKISRKEIKRRVGREEEYEVDPENLQNKFNLAVKDLRDEILFYIRGQRQQLSFEFSSEDAEQILAVGEKLRGRSAAERVVNFPGSKSAAQ
jgi:hypothetical protein